MMDPLRYLKFLAEVADEISETISEANLREQKKSFVIYSADLYGNLYRRKTFDLEKPGGQIYAASESARSYVIWHGYSDEIDADEIREDIIGLIESGYDELKATLASEN